MLLSVRVNESIGKKLENLSLQTHRTKSFYVKEALLSYIDDFEDIYLAESRLENLKVGKDKILNSKDFWNDLES
jgi:RHH-type rel operon transcriptional repressor/antitoxin RelB